MTELPGAIVNRRVVGILTLVDIVTWYFLSVGGGRYPVKLVEVLVGGGRYPSLGG